MSKEKTPPQAVSADARAAVTVYGIPNCDTVKKSRDWFAAQVIDFVFHDFKKQGLDAQTLHHWLTTVGWELVLNRKSASWRQLDEAQRASVHDAASAQAVIATNLSLIKRPVVVFAASSVQAAGAAITVGFAPQAWAEQLHIQPPAAV